MMKYNGWKALFIILLNCLSNYCFAAWPLIRPMHGTEIFNDAHSAKLLKTIFDKDGKAMYELECRSGDLDDDKFNYSGLFHCRLSSVIVKANERSSLLFEEGAPATSDWDGRGRFLLEEVIGNCGSYEDFGAKRTYLLLEMRINLKISNVILVNNVEEVQAKSFVFTYEVNTDSTATSAYAKPSPIREPSWFNGKEGCSSK